MFREIRRVKNEISVEEAKKLLLNNKRGVISFNGEDEYPYSIPINYYYNEVENKLYFHCAKKGYKIDCIEKNNKSCFVTYGNEELSENGWSYYVSSAIVFGKIEIIKDRNIIVKEIKKLASKYYPSSKEIEEAINNSIDAVSMFTLNIEHISGKRVHEK